MPEPHPRCLNRAGPVAALGTKALVGPGPKIELLRAEPQAEFALAQAQNAAKALETLAGRWLQARELALGQLLEPLAERWLRAKLQEKKRSVPAQLRWEQFVRAQKPYRTRSQRASAVSGTAGPFEPKQAFPARAMSLSAWKPPARSKQALRTREPPRRNWQPPGEREPPPEHSAPQVIATRRRGRR